MTIIFRYFVYTCFIFSVNSVQALGGGRRDGFHIVRDFGVVENDMDASKVEDEGPIMCQDDQGNSVEWFVVYKLPKTPDSADTLLKEGSAHYFLLPGSSEWTRSPVAISDSKSIVGRTIEPLNSIFTGKSDIAAVLYNDQPPNLDPTIRDGHTKGIMLANSKGGFWLPHSIPHFPIPGPKFGYPAGGLENGQMLLCLSLGLDTLNQVFGGSLQYTKATFYNSTIPHELQDSLQNIHKVIHGMVPATKLHYASYRIPLKEFQFDVLVKGPKFHREIYADWIAPRFNVDLDVQSWLQGSHAFLSNCTSNCTVLNILEKSMQKESFSYSDDHSKWAVSSKDRPVTCIADLNRSKPQKGRGGVALCTEYPLLWKAFRSLVVSTQPCNTTKAEWTRENKRRLAAVRL